jgi:hypothetical protein
MRKLMEVSQWVVWMVVFGMFGTAAGQEEDDVSGPIQLSAKYQIEKGTRNGRLVVQCAMPDGAHIYSLDQATPPGPTKFKIGESEAFRMTGKWSANRDPEVIEHDPVFETRIEQFDGKVAFTAPLEIDADADLKQLSIELALTCQVCTDSNCVPIRNRKIEVEFGGFFDPAKEQDETAPNGVKPSDKPGGG